MIQVYKESNTDYAHNGDCVLMPSECRVEAEINGAWSATLIHPIDPEGRWNYLTAETVVKLPSFNGDQLFRIKTREKSLNEVYCKLEPIFFDSGGDCWLYDINVSNKTGQQALNLMTDPNSKYSGESNITTRKTTKYHWKTLTEAISGDDENSFLNKWGGEILYDNFKVIIKDQIGSDNGLEVRYGKNLEGIDEKVDMTDLITRIWPLTYCGHPMRIGYVTSPLESNYPIPKQCVITFDNIRYKDDITDEAKEIEEGRTVVHNQSEIDFALYNACLQEFAAGIDKPVITLEVDMVLVGYTEQYADLKGLESVSLGDTVYVISENINVNTAMRVYKLEYDCIRERAVKIQLGSEGYNYFKNLSKDIRVQQTALSDAQVQIADVLGMSEETGLTLAEVVDGSGAGATLKGTKLQGSNWYGTADGIVFNEQQTRSGNFRMIMEDGIVKFQSLASGATEWTDIGYIKRFTQTGDEVLGMVSAPNENARIWVEDADKYVWLSGQYINLYDANLDGKIVIMSKDIHLQTLNKPMQSWDEELYGFHPFHFEHVPIDAPSAWMTVNPPANSGCKYLIQAAVYGDSSDKYVTGIINDSRGDFWTILFNTASTSGYVTCIWI